MTFEATAVAKTLAAPVEAASKETSLAFSKASPDFSPLAEEQRVKTRLKGMQSLTDSCEGGQSNENEIPKNAIYRPREDGDRQDFTIGGINPDRFAVAAPENSPEITFKQRILESIKDPSQLKKAILEIAYQETLSPGQTSSISEAVNKIIETPDKEFGWSKEQYINARELLAQLTVLPKEKFTQLNPETRITVAEWISRPLTGEKPDPARLSKAVEWLSGLENHPELMPDRPHEFGQAAKIARAILDDEVMKMPEAKLRNSREARETFLRRVTEVASDVYGIERPELEFDDNFDHDGGVPGYSKKITVNLSGDKFNQVEPGKEREYLIELGVHELRHVYQHALIAKAGLAPPDAESAKFIGERQLTTQEQLTAKLYAAGNFLHHEILAEVGVVEAGMDSRKHHNSYKYSPVEIDAERAARDVLEEMESLR